MIRKAGYILGGILTLAFCIGSFKPDVTFKTSVVINKPLTETYQLFEDRSSVTNWLPEAVESMPVQIKPDKIGSVYQITILEGTELIKFNEKIVDYRPNRLLGLESEKGFLLRQDNYLFEAVGDHQTKLINDSRCEGSNFIFRSIYAFSSSRLINEEEQYLAAFKKFAEDSASL